MVKSSKDHRAKSKIGGFAESPQRAFDVGPADIGETRMQSVLESARGAGLLELKTARISGRISPALIAQAKRRTGMTSDSELIEFALASVALDDPFMEVFRQVRGTIDADVDLGD